MHAYVCVLKCASLRMTEGNIDLFLMNEESFFVRSYMNEYGCLHGVQPAYYTAPLLSIYNLYTQRKRVHVR